MYYTNVQTQSVLNVPHTTSSLKEASVPRAKVPTLSRTKDVFSNLTAEMESLTLEKRVTMET